MEIYCRQKELLEQSIKHARTLEIDDKQAVLTIKTLPPQFSQMGLIEYPRHLDAIPHITIYIKNNSEKYITLAHEMVHLRQILTDGIICEKEAYELEKNLTMTTAF